MSETKIDLAALRSTLLDEALPFGADTLDVFFALIEAVEAAEAFASATESNPIPLVAEQPFRWQELTDALDRFDFDGEQ